MSSPERLLSQAQSLTDDLIVAVSSPPGRGAIGIVRVSGSPDAVSSLLHKVVGERVAANLQPRRLQLVALKSPEDGAVVDRGLVARFPGPNSYTGQDVVEFHLHGNPVILRLATLALLAGGARAASPGEFTRRAVTSGRMSLVQAEAVDALVRAESEGAVRAAHRHLGGELATRVGAWRDRLLEVAAALEASVDFPDELHEGEGGWDGADLGLLQADMASLVESYEAGRRLMEGARVVLAGPVNAGKSTLFNSLLGHGRAIVSDRPGTTRDVVSETLSWGGAALRLEDTAGLRGAEDPVEIEGIERSEEATRQADLVVWVMDGRQLLKRAGDDSGNREDRLPVATHGDLLTSDERAKLEQAGWTVVAAPSGAGLSALRDQLVRAVEGGSLGSSLLLHTERQRAALETALSGVSEAIGVGAEEPVLAALGVRAAGRALDELCGEWTDEGVLDTLFERFCIGK